MSHTDLGIRTADTDATTAADSPEWRRVQYCAAVPTSCMCKMPTAGMLARLRSVTAHDTSTELVFGACDSNAGGKLTREEFRAAVSALDAVCTDEDIDAMIMLADTDGNGPLNCREFATLVGSVGGRSPAESSPGPSWGSLGPRRSRRASRPQS